MTIKLVIDIKEDKKSTLIKDTLNEIDTLSKILFKECEKVKEIK